MAQSVSGGVTLQQQDNGRAVLRSAGMAPKAKEAQADAVLNAFRAVLYDGVPGLQNGAPMLVGQNKSFDYRFFDTQYRRYLLSDPVKLSEDKIQGERRVTMEVAIDLEGLKKAVCSGGCTLSPVWKDQVDPGAKTSVAPMAAVRPSIVVIPYAYDSAADFQDMADLVSGSPTARAAVNAVAARFGDKGYVTKDFITLLQNSDMGALTSSGAQTDVLTEIVRQLPGDITVTVDAVVEPRGESSQCTLNLKAVERQTGDQLATQSFVSGRYKGVSGSKLVAHAVEMMNDDFFTQLDAAFKRRMDEGLPMVVEFQLGESVSDWDFDTPVPASGEDFKTWLSDWLRDHSQNRAYDRSAATDKYVRASINVPLWDSDTNRPYGPDSFASALRRALRKVLADEYDVKVTEMGQRLVVTIK